MGGKSSGPDYGNLAMQQGQANKEVNRDQTYANRPSQYTPWGYTNWTNESVIDPSTGLPTTKWSQTQGFTPEIQDIFNKQVAIQGDRTDIAGSLTNRMGTEFGTPIDWRSLSPMGGVPTSQFTMPEGDIQNRYTLPSNDVGGRYTTPQGDIGDPNGWRQRSTDAMYNTAKSRLDPMYSSKRQALETQMRNQGIGPEDAAWKAQMGTLGNQENDAYNQANWSSVGAGRDESNAMYAQMMGRNQNMYNQQLGANQQNFGQDIARSQNSFNQDLASNQQNFGQDFSRSQNSFNQALQANQQNYGQALQGSQYANQIRQQQMAEAMQKRGFSLNEINALLSGQQVQMPGMPNFSQAQAADAAPVYQAGVAQGNFDQASNPMNGLMGLAGTALGAYAGSPTGGAAIGKMLGG